MDPGPIGKGGDFLQRGTPYRSPRRSLTMTSSNGVPEEETPAMTIALTCDCGARYEVEDLFAGQEVNCPECQHRTRAPLVKGTPRRTSLLALYSLVVAIFGACTLVGSAAGALLALIAIVRMNTGRVPRGGMGYAVAALVVAVAGAAATLGILYSPAKPILVGWQRRGGFASRVDTSGPAEVGSRDNACVLTRPPDWGRLLQGRGLDPSIDYLQANRDLILIGPQGDAYIDIHRDASDNGPLKGVGDRLFLELKAPPLTADPDDDDPKNRPPKDQFKIRDSAELPDFAGYEGMEWTVDLRRGRQTWRWLLRVYRKRQVVEGQARPVYVLRAYAPARRFEAVQSDLKKALDSVRFPP